MSVIIFFLFFSFSLFGNDDLELMQDIDNIVKNPAFELDGILSEINIIEPEGISGCPRGMTPVTLESSVCVDRWEAFLVEVIDNSEYLWSPYYNPGDRFVRAKSAPHIIPQGYINQIQAKKACENAGKRLCSDEEWLLSCQSEDELIYPYGNFRREGVCNDHREKHPAIEYFGTSASWIWLSLDDAGINQLEDSLDFTGENSECVSKNGAYDMMGNLHEWTDDKKGTFRGGFYTDTVVNGEGCEYVTTAHHTGYFDYSTGFRCCADKE